MMKRIAIWLLIVVYLPQTMGIRMAIHFCAGDFDRIVFFDDSDSYPDAYWCMSISKWWEGYDAHETVIINDYRKDFCKFSELLNLLDRYPYRIECKGSSRQMLAKTIVITTPKSPEETWKNRTDEDLTQLMRRIDKVLFFEVGTGTGTEVGGNTNSPTPETIV